MFLGANIPIRKSNNPFVQKFLPIYTDEDILGEFTLRKHYIPKSYAKTLNQIRNQLVETIFAYLLIKQQIIVAENSLIANVIFFFQIF